PSKNKTQIPPFSFRKQQQQQQKLVDNSSPFSELDYKNIFFFLIFLGALILFLSSLSGIGPVNEEFLVRKGATDDLHNNKDWEEISISHENEIANHPLNVVDNDNHDNNEDIVIIENISFKDKNDTFVPNDITNDDDTVRNDD